MARRKGLISLEEGWGNLQVSIGELVGFCAGGWEKKTDMVAAMSSRSNRVAFDMSVQRPPNNHCDELLRNVISAGRCCGNQDLPSERDLSIAARSCDFTAHMFTGMILSNYKLFVNPLFKLISIEHVIIGSKTQWKTM